MVGPKPHAHVATLCIHQHSLGCQPLHNLCRHLYIPLLKHLQRGAGKVVASTAAGEKCQVAVVQCNAQHFVVFGVPAGRPRAAQQACRGSLAPKPCDQHVWSGLTSVCDLYAASCSGSRVSMLVLLCPALLSPARSRSCIQRQSC